uniref:Neuropeptide F n=1 Tax=Graphocephala atropunctata TaxID=36148 RepID=A0A1B6M7D5_9HEMI
MMWTVNLTLAGCLCMLVLAAPCCCEPLAGPDPIARPARPKSFASPDDLRLYLDQLGQYFAVVGRPRFGKRTAVAVSKSAQSAVAAPRELLPSYQPAYPQTDTADLYDIFPFYQAQQAE